MTLSRSSLFSAFIVMAAAAAIGMSLSLMDSPAKARAKRLDDDKVTDLQMLSNEIEMHYHKHGAFPADLTKLKGFHPIRNPLVSYQYHITGASSYELCAAFDEETDTGRNTFRTHWKHPKGRFCFPFDRVPQTPAPPR
jgi:hypothetical protein